MKRLLLVCIATPTLLFAASVPPGFVDTTLGTGITSPVDLDVSPDTGDPWVLNDLGEVWVIPAGLAPQLLAQLNPPLTRPSNDWCTAAWSGLAFDPDFATNQRVYFLEQNNVQSRVLRYVHAGGALLFDAEIVSALPPSVGCQRGGLDFGPDDSLLITLVKAQSTDPLDLTTPLGKVLRVDTDGQARTDNPYLGVAGADPRIYAIGYTYEAFRIAVDHVAAETYVGGASTIERLVPGAEYGSAWGTPRLQGQTPVYAVGAYQLSLGLVYRGASFPPIYQGVIFVSEEGDSHLLAVDPKTGSASVFGDLVFARAMAEAPDGSLIYAEGSGRIGRISYGAPWVDFCGDPTQGPAPLSTDFSAQELFTTSLDWDFGDGGVGSGASPTHGYSQNGLYTVTLTGTGSNGSSVETRVDYVEVVDGPTSEFSGTPVAGPPGLTVQFADLSTGSPTAWSWAFGDGGTSTAANPSHTYAASGSYDVSLSVSDGTSFDTVVKTSYVNVGPPPVAEFSGAPTIGGAPLSVSFSDLSLNGPTSWSWDFGDGNGSSAQSPTHTYLTPGVFDVALTVTNPFGTDTEVKTSYITVEVPPTADFTGSPTTGAAPLSVTFTDLSTGSPTGWSWDFGDGNGSSAQSPTHTYSSPGSYDVTLTVSSPWGTDTLVRPAYITVEVPPTADFTGSPTSGVAPLAVTFTDLSTGSPTGWSWDFGDGNGSSAQHPTHTYQNPGTYDVALSVTGAFGSDTLNRPAFITVTASFVPPGILTGLGADPAAPSRVQAWDLSSQPFAGIDFAAYGTPGFGVDVAVGELDGVGSAELLSGPGPSPVYGPHVRGFFTPTAQPIARVTFYAYGTLKYGVHPSRGDIDGDGIEEIQTTPGPGAVFGPHVRAFDWDGGTLRSLARVNFFAFGTLRYGAHADASEMDRDGFAEMTAAPGPGPTFGPQIRGFEYDASSVQPLSGLDFFAFASGRFGAEVALADVLGDGAAEVLVGPGPSPNNPTTVRGFAYAGSVSGVTGLDFEAYPTAAYGVRLGGTDLDGDGRAEILTVPAGPSLGAEVKAFSLQAGVAVELSDPAFTADPGYRYGGNIDAGDLGF